MHLQFQTTPRMATHLPHRRARTAISSRSYALRNVSLARLVVRPHNRLEARAMSKIVLETDTSRATPTPVPGKRMTAPAIRARKKDGVTAEPLVMLTAYTMRMAQLLDPHCEMLLVGDSLGQVIYGLPSTLPVTLEMMCAHGAAVVRGSWHALVAVDMPFGSYEGSPEQAFASASRILQETGCAAVKLEGGEAMAPTIELPGQARHSGHRPRRPDPAGGQHRSAAMARAARATPKRRKILGDAKAVADAGAFCMVIEGVMEGLADELTKAVAIPTIGIGASKQLRRPGAGDRGHARPVRAHPALRQTLSRPRPRNHRRRGPISRRRARPRLPDRRAGLPAKGLIGPDLLRLGFAFALQPLDGAAPASVHLWEGKEAPAAFPERADRGCSWRYPPAPKSTRPSCARSTRNIAATRCAISSSTTASSLIVAVVLFLAAAGGWIWWQSTSASRPASRSRSWPRSIQRDRQGQCRAGRAAAQGARGQLAATRSARTAIFTAAALDLENDNTKAATAKYRAIAEDDGLPQPYRDIALIRQTALEFDQLKPEEVIARMEPLAKPGEPWFGSAGEMTALALIKQGKKARGRQVVRRDRPRQDACREVIRGRSVQMASSLGVDASDAC